MNKFGSELVKTQVFNKGEKVVCKPSQVNSGSKKPTTGKKYSKMLDEMVEGTYGVNVQIPLSYYRRMRDYKDLHKEESFQSMVLSAIIEWVDRNA